MKKCYRDFLGMGSNVWGLWVPFFKVVIHLKVAIKKMRIMNKKMP